MVTLRKKRIKRENFQSRRLKERTENCREKGFMQNSKKEKRFGLKETAEATAF